MYLWLWLIPVLIIVGGLTHMAVAARPWPRGRGFEIALLHLLFWGVGLGSLFAFYSMTFEPLASRIAADLGWGAQNPFQKEAALGLLVLGVLGVLSVWLRGGFWVATVVLALLTGWTELGVIWVHGAKPSAVWVNVVYDGVGTSVGLILLIWYRVRAGYNRFWSPTLTGPAP